jgi:hypothetical protein
MTLRQHPEASRYATWHPSGLHIDSDAPITQRTIDHLLFFAATCTVPSQHEGEQD